MCFLLVSINCETKFQTEYLGHCVRHILSLYSASANPPSSVVLIGHSLGGVVAKALLSRPDFAAQSVRVLITLATPHEPVLVLDSETRAFYDGVDSAWNASRTLTVSKKGKKTKKRPLDHVTFVSIGGGGTVK